MQNTTDKKRTNLLTFKMDLNKEGNIEFDLNAVEVAELEKVLAKTGDVTYAHRVGDVLRDYFKDLSFKIKTTRA